MEKKFDVDLNFYHLLLCKFEQVYSYLYPQKLMLKIIRNQVIETERFLKEKVFIWVLFHLKKCILSRRL